MPLTFSKKKLLESLEDPDLKRAFTIAIHPTSSKGEKIDWPELIRIIRSALDKHGTDAQGKAMRTINKREWRDLQRIYRYVHLMPDAREKLKRFFDRRSKKRAKRFVSNIIDSPREKKWISGLLSQSTAYPPKGLRLPDDGMVYNYQKFKTVAELIENDFVTAAEFHYGGSGETEAFAKRNRHGAYNSSKDWLYFERGVRNWQAIIIHEATHVIQDWNNMHVTVGHLESAAFLLQAVRIIKIQGEGHLSGSFRKDAIKTPAKQLAEGKKGVLTDSEYDSVKQVLKDIGYDVDEHRNRAADKGSEAEQIIWKMLF